MAIISINYSKIHAEKSKKQSTGQISIKNNVGITNITLGTSHTSEKQKAIIIEFTFSITYEPIGLISIDGAIIDIEEDAKAKEIVDMWTQHKRVEKDLTTKVITIVLEKCTIKAIIISQDIGLPSPVPLPKVRMNVEGANKEEKKESKEDAKKENSKDKKKK